MDWMLIRQRVLTFAAYDPSCADKKMAADINVPYGSYMVDLFFLLPNRLKVFLRYSICINAITAKK